MTSYRIAAVAAVSSANATLSTLLYLPGPAPEVRRGAREVERFVPGAPDDALAAVEVESQERR
jgi:hypothetical protein